MGDVGRNSIKWFMFGFNLILCLAGLLLIVLAIVMRTSPEIMSTHLKDSPGLEILPLTTITIGLLILVVAFIGCVGVVGQNFCFLVTFATILSVIFLGQMGVGIAASAKKEEFVSFAVGEWNKSLQNYFNSSHRNQDTVDSMQKELHCCGLKNYTDWFEITFNNNSVAPSCCISSNCTAESLTKEELDPKCQQGNSPECPIFTHGCRDGIRSRIKTLFETLSGLAIAIAFIELIGIVFSCYLAKRIRSGYEYLD